MRQSSQIYFLNWTHYVDSKHRIFFLHYLPIPSPCFHLLRCCDATTKHGCDVTKTVTQQLAFDADDPSHSIAKGLDTKLIGRWFSVSESRVMNCGVYTFEGFLFGIELQSGHWLNSSYLRHCHRNSHPLAWEQWWVVDNSSLRVGQPTWRCAFGACVFVLRWTRFMPRTVAYMYICFFW